MSSANRVNISVIRNGDRNVVLEPEERVYRTVEISSENLEMNRGTVDSKTIRDDRNTDGLIQVSHGATGGFRSEFRPHSFDSLMRGAFRYGETTTTDDEEVPNGENGIESMNCWSDHTGGDSRLVTATSTLLSDDFSSLNLEGFLRDSLDHYALIRIEAEHNTTTDINGFYRLEPTRDRAVVGYVPSMFDIIVRRFENGLLSGNGDGEGGVRIEIVGLNATRNADTMHFYNVSCDSIHNGTTEYTFSIQKEHTDIDEKYLMTGSQVNKMTLSIDTQSIIQIEFDFISQEMKQVEDEDYTEPLDSLGVENSALITDATNSVSEIKINDTPAEELGLYFTKIEVTVDNNLRGKKAIGHTQVIGIESGDCKVSGSFEVYFENEEFRNMFDANEFFKFNFQIGSEEGARYYFELERCQIENYENATDGVNTDIVQKMSFVCARGELGLNGEDGQATIFMLKY